MTEYFTYLFNLIKNFLDLNNKNDSLAVVKIDRYGNTHVVMPGDEQYNKDIARLELKRNNKTFLDKVKGILKNIFKSKEDRST
jgi:hypothetical protein